MTEVTISLDENEVEVVRTALLRHVDECRDNIDCCDEEVEDDNIAAFEAEITACWGVLKKLDGEL